MSKPAPLILIDLFAGPAGSSGGDPVNVYRFNPDPARPLGRAAVGALLLHLLLLLLVRFEIHHVELPQPDVLQIIQLAAAGSLPQQAAEPAPAPVPAPKPLPVPVPGPIDLTARPEAPPTPRLSMVAINEFGIGEIPAPRGGPAGAVRSGQQAGPRSGPDAVVEPGSGVSPPTLIHHTTPTYTDAAIKARAAGTVLISAVIRADGSITDLRVLRGLGYGLDEAALEEIARHWRFLPGRLNGNPVNVRATIEFSFALR